jgi:glycosyltransferase involved in cell wall biosynthesis
VLGTAVAGAGYLLLDLFLRRCGIEGTLGDGLVARLAAGAPGNVLARASEELDSLAHACELLLRDPALRRRLGEAAACEVHARYTWDRNAARVLDLARSLIAGRAGAG